MAASAPHALLSTLARAAAPFALKPLAHRRLRGLAGAVLVVLAGSNGLPCAASAQTKPKTKAKVQAAPVETGGLTLEEIAVMLSSNNPDEVVMAIESSALLRDPSAAALLLERVRAGLPPDMLEAALDALAVLNSPASRDVFIQMSRHRRESVRVRSVRALGSQRSPESEAALVVALGDAASSVRENAAEALGKTANTSSLGPLFLAFDRGVLNAGRSIAKLIPDDQVGRLTGLLGRVPFSSLTFVFDLLLSRRDLPEDTKLALVAQIAELGTSDARGYFEALRTKLPEDATARLRKAIDDAASRIAQ